MSKAEDWMPLYLGAYLADTAALTTLQHGAYFLLIMAYWKRGPLPADHGALANIARVDRAAWDGEIWPALRGFFKCLRSDGLLHQSRLDFERAQRGTKKRTPPITEEDAPPPEPTKPASIGSRLPADWKPGPEFIAFAKAGGLNPQHVAVRFADYWHAKAGADACKVDWLATWRSWCRRTTGWKEPEAAARAATVERAAPKIDEDVRRWL